MRAVSERTRWTVYTGWSSTMQGAGAMQVSIPLPEYEYARGDNITLPCKFVPMKSPNPLIIVIWTVDAGDPSEPEIMLLTYYSTGDTDVNTLYEGRASLDLDLPNGKVDLKLNRITLQDNTMFSCRVQIPKDDKGTLSDSVRLVVLVAPSQPVCKIQGTAEYGENINLTCLSEEGSPTPAYTWEQRDVRNTPRPPAPRTTDRGGILSLYNVSIETSGYFTCTSKNKIRSASCNITLTVLPPSMKLGATAGFIGGGVALLLLLGIVICCCCYHKKKKKDEEYAMGSPEEVVLDEKEPIGNGKRDRRDDRDEEERSEAGTARRSDYDDRRIDKDDRHSDYTARRTDYDDRRSDYDDRRSDYDDRRSDYSDRRDRYEDDRRNDHRADRHRDDDRMDRRRDDDRVDRRRDDYRNEDDRYDEPYNNAEPARPKPPSLPSNKPPRVKNVD
ncbi:unnamed protein product [Lota lota]